MKTWTVTGGVVGSKYLGEVKAKTAKQAIKKAWALATGVSFCHQCSGECEDPDIASVHLYSEDDEAAEDHQYDPAQKPKRVLRELLAEATRLLAMCPPGTPEPKSLAEARELLK